MHHMELDELIHWHRIALDRHERSKPDK